MHAYLSFQVWTAAQWLRCGLVIVSLGLMSHAWVDAPPTVSGMAADAAGIVLLWHMSLHGWTVFKGTFWQRLLLVWLWFFAVIFGWLAAKLLGLD